MTNQEAVEELKERIKLIENDYRAEAEEYKQVLELAVNALCEIQQYRAIGTVEELKSANMERTAAHYGGGWIPCEDRLPLTAEYMELEPTPYMKRLEIAYMTDTVEYLIGFYDGSKWMNKHHDIIKNVIAWKPFEKLPEPYHEPRQIGNARTNETEKRP